MTAKHRSVIFLLRLLKRNLSKSNTSFLFFVETLRSSEFSKKSVKSLLFCEDSKIAPTSLIL